MEWTFMKPSVPGLYVYRIGHQHGVRAAVVTWAGSGKNKQLEAMLTGTRLSQPVSALSGEWAGPIPEPQEKR
jgi:hypothetical protein